MGVDSGTKPATGSDLAVLEEPVLEAARGAALLLSRRAQCEQQWHRSRLVSAPAENVCKAG